MSRIIFITLVLVLSGCYSPCGRTAPHIKSDYDTLSRFIDPQQFKVSTGNTFSIGAIDGYEIVHVQVIAEKDGAQGLVYIKKKDSIK